MTGQGDKADGDLGSITRRCHILSGKVSPLRDRRVGSKVWDRPSLPSTSLLAGRLSCRLEIGSLHNRVVQRGPFANDDKVPSCRLAAFSRGPSFVPGWTGLLPHSLGTFPCSSHLVGMNPSSVNDPHVNHPWRQ